MRTCYRVLKGGQCESELMAIPGVIGAWTNPFGAGADVVEVEHDRDPFAFPDVVKDQTLGTVILECLRKPKDPDFKFSREVGSLISEYEGFTSLYSANADLLRKTFLVVIAYAANGTDLWAVEDEAGFRELQRWYTDDRQEARFVTAKPFTIHRGSEVVPICRR